MSVITPRAPVGRTDWNTWIPKERGTLCFVLRDHQILLIEKKRGLGAGKVNGPGGRIEPGETPEQAAIRETQEEIGITPVKIDWAGELHFQFRDGYSLHCTVYRAGEFSGDPIETAEAKPFWHPVAKMPYDRMWADDEHWMPRLLAGERFRGWFEFESDRMQWFWVEAA